VSKGNNIQDLAIAIAKATGHHGGSAVISVGEILFYEISDEQPCAGFLLRAAWGTGHSSGTKSGPSNRDLIARSRGVGQAQGPSELRRKEYRAKLTEPTTPQRLSNAGNLFLAFDWLRLTTTYPTGFRAKQPS